MAAVFEKFQIRARQSREAGYGTPGDVRIVLGVEHQDLSGDHILGAVNGIVELASVELLPVAVGEAISVSEGFTDVGSIAWVRGFCFLAVREDRPVDHRAVGDYFLHARVEGAQQSGGASEASTDYKNLVRSEREFLAESQISDSVRQFADYIEDVFMWGARQELAVAFPGSAVAGIKHPVAFAGEEI